MDGRSAGEREDLVDAGQGEGAVEEALTTRETVFWYSFAATSYIIASIIQKSLLNWFVGPLWLVVVIWFGPILDRRFRRWRRSRGGAEA